MLFLNNKFFFKRWIPFILLVLFLLGSIGFFLYSSYLLLLITIPWRRRKIGFFMRKTILILLLLAVM